MGVARSKYVRQGEEGVYHCYSRCVRRAFLFGKDALTGRDFSHRKAWFVERLRYLATIFAIEVCAYAILATHWHSVLRTRPDIVARWSDREVAIRWLTLFPPHKKPKDVSEPLSEEQICLLANCPERIAELRQRLCSLSWFMGRMNEFIARKANKEDGVTGRFWEGRFKCEVLLDEAATAAAMVYVDLNPVRAGLAATPEESDFTSIQERIRSWQKENMIAGSTPNQSFQNALSKEEIGSEMPEPTPRASWLCPIQSDAHRRGILQMTEAEYFALVDRSGRILRADKRGAIDPDLDPILLRIGAIPRSWLDIISNFGRRFHLAAGSLSSLRRFADKIGRRWLSGSSAARASFSVSQTPRV
jgi:hypothetical protein